MNRVSYCKKSIYFLSLLSLFIFEGCSSTSEKHFDEKFPLGGSVTVTQGHIIASNLKGDTETRRNWVGIMNSEDGWGPGYIEFSDDFMETKLYYLGAQEPNFFLMYREYRMGNEQPSVNQVEDFDWNESPYAALGDFYVKLDNIDGKQATFSLLDKKTWVEKKNEHIVQMENKRKKEQLKQIILQAKGLIEAIHAGNSYIAQFSPEFNSYKQALNELDQLTSIYQNTIKSGQPIEQITQTYQQLIPKLSSLKRYFSLVSETLSAWNGLHNALNNAVQSGIKDNYLSMAKDMKLAGENYLTQEQFEAANGQFLSAQVEIARVTRYFSATEVHNLNKGHDY